MKSILTATMRDIDRQAIEADPTAGWRLMRNAGAGIANQLERFARHAGVDRPRAVFFAGTGNNGGDAFVASRLCASRGWSVRVWLAGEKTALQGDAARAADEYCSANLPLLELKQVGEDEILLLKEYHPHLVIDGLLGTGAKGEPRGIVADAIGCINQAARDCFCIAIDAPSGLNADEGLASNCCVKADLTLTLGLPQPGLLKKEAEEVVGSLDVIDIGLPQALVDGAERAGEVELNALSDLRTLWKSKARESHKGTFGRVLVLGGSPGMSGAPALSARAALRAGAGLVFVLGPDSVTSEIAVHSPEIMVKAAASNREGQLDASFLNRWQDFINEMDCVVIGPGLGQSDEMILILRQLIRDTTVPMIMDADALNNLERQAHWLERANVPLGITPHPGEMSRLFGQSIETIQQDREGTAEAAAKFIQSTVILKGAGTIIAHPGSRPVKNMTGNPGMATGGTGDVLAGMFGALVAQGYALFDAARLAVYLHGKAGDIASLTDTQSSMTASRLIDRLPEAFRLLEVR